MTKKVEKVNYYYLKIKISFNYCLMKKRKAHCLIRCQHQQKFLWIYCKATFTRRICPYARLYLLQDFGFAQLTGNKSLVDRFYPG